MPVALLTGFEPFGVHATNPSWDAIRTLERTPLDDWTLTVARLPVDYRAVAECLPQLLAERAPALILHLGVMRQEGVSTLR